MPIPGTYNLIAWNIIDLKIIKKYRKSQIPQGGEETNFI